LKNKTLDFGFWILDFGLKSTRTVSFVAAVAVAIVLSCFGCVGNRTVVSPVAIETREVRDDLGRTMNVPVNIERAISLAPSVTEMIFAVGAGDRLVGVTTYCNYPVEAAAIEKVGDTQTPNIERIIALKPQIVVVSTASQLEAFSRTLEEQGIAVYVTNPVSLTDVFKNLRQFGELFGTRPAAGDLVARLSTRVANVDIAAQIYLDEKPTQKVFVQISNDPLFTIGSDSFLTELVDRAGGISATNDVPTAYPTLSKETAAALDPDVIILSDSEDNREPNSALKDSKAVKNRRVYRVNADILSRPGPRLVDALEEIASKLTEPNS
jgi:iron complex transport system substrate-binding protein